MPAAHPLRPIRQMVDNAPRRLVRQSDELRASQGSLSIVRERLHEGTGVDAVSQGPQRADADGAGSARQWSFPKPKKACHRLNGMTW